MIEGKKTQIKEVEGELNELLEELEKISRKIIKLPLTDLDKKLYLEFLERVYYRRDELRNKAKNPSKKKKE